MPDVYENSDHLTPTFRLWPDEQGGPWLIVFFWQIISGRAECVGIDLTSTRSPHVESFYSLRDRPEVGVPLTTSLLRDLRLSELIADERANLDYLVGEQTTAYRATQMRERTARRLQQVADVYREAWRDGKPPVKAVAKQLKVSSSAATGLVARARAAGMLPPTSPGVAVGEARREEGEAG